MPKQLNCICGKYLGEMEKGKVRKGVVMRCATCEIQIQDKLTQYDMAAKMAKLGGGNSKPDMSAFEGLFGYLFRN